MRAFTWEDYQSLLKQDINPESVEQFFQGRRMALQITNNAINEGGSSDAIIARAHTSLRHAEELYYESDFFVQVEAMRATIAYIFDEKR